MSNKTITSCPNLSLLQQEQRDLKSSKLPILQLLNVNQTLWGGGDQQIGAEVAEGNILAIFFFRDPLTSQPHEPDVSALIRLCDVHKIPLATNIKTAEILIKGLESLIL